MPRQPACLDPWLDSRFWDDLSFIISMSCISSYICKCSIFHAAPHLFFCYQKLAFLLIANNLSICQLLYHEYKDEINEPIRRLKLKMVLEKILDIGIGKLEQKLQLTQIRLRSIVCIYTVSIPSSSFGCIHCDCMHNAIPNIFILSILGHVVIILGVPFF